VDYDECFQCLDCVVIYESDALCVPLMQQKKSARDGLVIPIVALPATPNRKMS
jgi:hypothetical protein